MGVVYGWDFEVEGGKKAGIAVFDRQARSLLLQSRQVVPNKKRASFIKSAYRESRETCSIGDILRYCRNVQKTSTDSSSLDEISVYTKASDDKDL